MEKLRKSTLQGVLNNKQKGENGETEKTKKDKKSTYLTLPTVYREKKV